MARRRTPEELLARAWQRFDRDHFAEAIADCDALLAQSPEHAEALAVRAAARAREAPRWRQPPEALADAERAVQLAPRSALSHWARGTVFLIVRRYDDALQAVTRALKLDRGNWRLLALRGSVRLGQEEYSKARKDLTAASQQAPNDPRVHVGLGAALVLAGEHEEGLRMLNRALRLNRRLALAYFYRAYLAEERYDYAGAAADLDRALTIEPENPDFWANRSQSHLKLDEPTEALATANEALRREPAHKVALNNRGAAHHALGQFEEALADFTAVLEIDPDYDLARENQAGLLRQLGRHQEMVAALTEAITREPDEGGLYYQRAEARRSLGQYQEALKDYAEAAKRDEYDHDPYLGRAAVFTVLGDLERARLERRKAVQLEPELREQVW